MWGKDAGWAHSVLFTADLRTFSDRLTVKNEAAFVKQEENVAIVTEVHTKNESLISATIKRERQEDEEGTGIQGSIVEQKVAIKRNIKRRRKT